VLRAVLLRVCSVIRIAFSNMGSQPSIGPLRGGKEGWKRDERREWRRVRNRGRRDVGRK
jgi:hypothetical protein